MPDIPRQPTLFFKLDFVAYTIIHSLTTYHYATKLQFNSLRKWLFSRSLCNKTAVRFFDVTRQNLHMPTHPSVAAGSSCISLQVVSVQWLRRYLVWLLCSDLCPQLTVQKI